MKGPLILYPHMVGSTYFQGPIRCPQYRKPSEEALAKGEWLDKSQPLVDTVEPGRNAGPTVTFPTCLECTLHCMQVPLSQLRSIGSCFQMLGLAL